MINRVKYKLLRNLILDVCHHSDCKTCQAGYTWSCLDGLQGSGCYAATFIFKQAQKVWGVEE